MTVKQAIQEVADELPEDADWAEAAYRLDVVRKILQGEAELDRGESIPHAEVVARLQRWTQK